VGDQDECEVISITHARVVLGVWVREMESSRELGRCFWVILDWFRGGGPLFAYRVPFGQPTENACMSARTDYRIIEQEVEVEFGLDTQSQTYPRRARSLKDDKMDPKSRTQDSEHTR
jgi:hypothetical protein